MLYIITPSLPLKLLRLWVTDWVQWQPQQESHTDVQQSAETLADAASAAWAHLLWRIARRISFSCRVYWFFCVHVVRTYAMWLQHKQKEDLGFAGIWGKVKSVWVCNFSARVHLCLSLLEVSHQTDKWPQSESQIETLSLLLWWCTRAASFIFRPVEISKYWTTFAATMAEF